MFNFDFVELLRRWWRLGQPQRIQWTEDDWESAFMCWLDGLSNAELLRELGAAMSEE